MHTNSISAIMMALAVAVAVPVLMSLPSAVSSDTKDPLFENQNFVGVSGPFLGSVNPIRGLNGGGRPWVLDQIEAKVMADGTFIVEVNGLVLTETGVNPVPSFRAVLSCLVPDGTTVTTVNLMTGSFPATQEGNASIQATLTLPSVCVAPIVFVTSPGLAWFAASGF